MDSNATTTENGLFWLQGNEEKKLWGTLHISEVNEVRLETFGSLTDPTEGDPKTILGQINSGQGFVTLIDCFPTNTLNFWLSRSGETDWSHQTYLVNTVVKGLLFEQGEEISFERATLRISSLPKWANPNLVQLDFADSKLSPFRVHVRIDDRTDDTTTVRVREESIKISLVFQPNERWEHSGVITRYLVEDDCLLAISRSDGGKMPLGSILSIAGSVLDLLSICCNETPRVTNIYVQLEKSEPSLTEVYVRMRGYKAEVSDGNPFPALGLSDLKGMEGVAQWVRVSEDYREPVAFLTSIWYNDKAYNQDKFSRVYAAVEGFVTRKRSRKRAKMTMKELACFVEEAMPDFFQLTGETPTDWAERVKGLRDQKISHLDPGSSVVIDGLAILVMTNVLYVAGASFLLREMGMDNVQIGKYLRGCNQSLLLNKNR